MTSGFQVTLLVADPFWVFIDGTVAVGFIDQTGAALALTSILAWFISIGIFQLTTMEGAAAGRIGMPETTLGCT